jgi:hypothetical protein
MLRVSERTFRRWRDRLHGEGPESLRDWRIGKPSSRRAAVAEILRMRGRYEERYEGFTVKHFHEQLVKRHHYKLGYTVTRLSLQSAGLVKPAPRRSAHREKRPRRAMVGMLLHQDASVGMLLHQDASRFAWLPGDAQQYDLVVTLDDATSEIYSAFLVEEEGTASSFSGLCEVIERHGLLCELCTDRGSHYFDIEVGARGSLGIVFVGARIAEINEHAVAHIFGDETVEAAHRLGDTLMIGADHLA